MGKEEKKEKIKSEWKKECKQLANKEVARREKENISKMEKLRFLDNKRGRQTYMKETFNDGDKL